MAEGWELPEYKPVESGTSSWGGSGNYSPTTDVAGSDSSWFDFGDESWYVNSTGETPKGEYAWLSDTGGELWDWLKSPQGTNVTAGAIKGLMSVWQQDLADRMKGKAEDKASDAELKDARVKVHNASINQPMDMGLIKLRR